VIPLRRHLAWLAGVVLAAGLGLSAGASDLAAAAAMKRYVPDPFQDADTVVRAVAGETAPVQARPVDGGPPRAVTVTTFTVENVLAGACPERVRVLPGKHPGYRAGTAYLLCLVPSAYAEVWQGVYGGRASIGIEDGRCVLPELYAFRDDERVLLGDFSVETVERAILRFRGPMMTVRPLHDTFRCDEALAFAVTLTNPCPEPMTLVVPAGDAFGRRLWLRLVDAHGFDVLSEAGYSPAYAATPPPPEEPADAKVTLAPGESVTREVRFRLVLSDFRQDPERVRSAIVQFSEWEGWHGRQYARCPVRLTCPYRRWADGLARSAPAWAVRVGGAYWGNEACHVTASRHDVPVSIILERGWVHQPGRGRGAPLHSEWRPFGDDADRATLAACFRVTRDGEPVAGPAPKADRVRALLDGFEPEAARPVIVDINLAEHFDFSEPGRYEVRLALPCEGGPSLSRVLHVYILKPTAGIH